MDDMLMDNKPQCDHIYLFENVSGSAGVLRKKSEGSFCDFNPQTLFKYCPECGQKLSTVPKFLGIEIAIDPTLPENTIEMRSSTSTVRMQIEPAPEVPVPNPDTLKKINEKLVEAYTSTVKSLFGIKD